MTSQLPSRPNIQYLKEQAKDILAELKKGKVAALKKMHYYFPHKINRETVFKLSDVQFV